MTPSPLPTAQKLREVLLVEPVISALTTLALTMFISHSTYGIIDWRPIAVLVSADCIGFGFDHYCDQAPALTHAQKENDHAIISVFTCSRIFLLLNALLLGIALICCPLSTWLITALLVIPALFWNKPLFSRNESSPDVQAKAVPNGIHSTVKRGFVLKRIPVMKALMVGIIRGCGYSVVIHSVLSTSMLDGHVATPWTRSQTLLWSTISWTCCSIMADIRDYTEDRALQIPTIPVMLNSVYKTRLLLTAVHTLTLLGFFSNVYFVLNTIYTIGLVWAMDENSPRILYRLNTHCQTPVPIMYAIIQGYKWFSSNL